MVTHPAPAARHRAAGRLWSALFFFLAAVLTLTTTAGNASAATVPTNENRVGVTAPKLITAVGVPDHISAGQHPVRAGPLQDLAQGHGVHDFYVIAGGAAAGTAVLVHNAGCGLLTNAQAAQMANRVGYKPTNQFLKGQRIFTNGKKYIVQDVDSHSGGLWKKAKTVQDLGSKTRRLGTYDYDLNYIGP